MTDYTEKDIYVVTCDQSEHKSEYASYGGGIDLNGPIVFEQYAENATLEHIQHRARGMSIHGKCRIAKLVFIDEE